MLASIAAWLASTPASMVIQSQLWIIPTVQTVHILGIAVVLSSVGMIDLRLFGLAGASSSVSQTAQRYLPWIWAALVVLALSGALMIVGEPRRSLLNPAFQWKMVLLAAAIATTAAFQITVRRNVALWDLAPSHRPWAKALALATLFIWLAIPVLGRWIAYIVVDEAA